MAQSRSETERLHSLYPGESKFLPQLPVKKNIQIGEAIYALRTQLQSHGNIDEWDHDPRKVPNSLTETFQTYRAKVNELVEGNMRLIGSVFKNHPFLLTFPQQDIEEFIGAGHEELVRSAQRYNPWYALAPDDIPYKTRKPGTFSTYAVGNMYFHMLSEMKGFHALHIPNWRWNQYKRYLEAQTFCLDQFGLRGHETVTAVAELMDEHKRLPKTQEINQYERNLGQDHEARMRHGKAMHGYAKLLILMEPMSFEVEFLGQQPFRDEDSGETMRPNVKMEDVLSSQADTPDQVVAHIRREVISKIFDQLWPGTESNGEIWYPRERHVLELRYGFADGEEHTIGACADYYNMSEATIKNILMRAKRALGHPSVRKMLRDFILD